MQAVVAAQEDQEYRRAYPNLVCPSYRNHGREAACVKCRDIGVLSVLLDAGNDRSGSRLIPCECSARIIGDRRTAAIVGEEVSREMRFEAFRLNWPDEQHNQVAANALAAAGAWARQEGPRWLALIGPTGTGKTFLAVSALRLMAERGVENAYWQAGEIMMLLKAGMRGGEPQVLADDARDRMLSCPAVVLDDYGIERHTEWADNEMETFLTLRYQRRLWTCVTSNKLAHLSDRLRSRLKDASVCVVADLSGGSDVRRWL